MTGQSRNVRAAKLTLIIKSIKACKFVTELGRDTYIPETSSFGLRWGWQRESGDVGTLPGEGGEGGEALH